MFRIGQKVLFKTAGELISEFYLENNYIRHSTEEKLDHLSIEDGFSRNMGMFCGKVAIITKITYPSSFNRTYERLILKFSSSLLTEEAQKWTFNSEMVNLINASLEKNMQLDYIFDKSKKITSKELELL